MNLSRGLNVCFGSGTGLTSFMQAGPILKRSHYQFGDTATAQDRLQLLADVFRNATRSFIQRVVTSTPEVALDLGSGLGFTASLLKESTGAKRVIGLESSINFIHAARDRFGNEVEFLEQDVMKTPFPTPAADLIYCRFLLSHLLNRKETIDAWTGQMATGGLLLLDEVESITTDESSLNKYLTFVQGLLNSQGQILYVGREISSWHVDGTEVISSDLSSLAVSVQTAASMFSLNLAQLRNREWSRQHRTAQWFDELSAELDALRRTDANASVIWRLRQHAIRKQSELT
jgi:ubiquinone/menaquinone biosynthesis C-methylase UbiE